LREAWTGLETCGRNLASALGKKRPHNVGHLRPSLGVIEAKFGFTVDFGKPSRHIGASSVGAEEIANQ
jgi:hypothetical protein